MISRNVTSADGAAEGRSDGGNVGLMEGTEVFLGDGGNGVNVGGMMGATVTKEGCDEGDCEGELVGA